MKQVELTFSLTKEQMKQAAEGLTAEELLVLAINKAMMERKHSLGIEITKLVENYQKSI
ncbi:hypothetical protein [Bacillus smithii]|uniref:hypothetical protein n=1 Tax=Bacillus smithii TaxID=1479 RepID=UPI002E1B7ED3|nr:hypothetical protein [Bacillus smithii]MED4929034.1 hypothetical protein [Bacillus smithii]